MTTGQKFNESSSQIGLRMVVRNIIAHLYLVNYKVECTTKRDLMTNVKQLQQRLVEECWKLKHLVLEATIMQWRHRLLACERVKGGHFEFKLVNSV